MVVLGDIVNYWPDSGRRLDSPALWRALALVLIVAGFKLILVG